MRDDMNLIDNYQDYIRYMDIDSDIETRSKVAKHYDANTTVYSSEMYKIIEDKINTSAGKNKYIKIVSKFIEDRYSDLYDTLPCSRIYFGQQDWN